MHNQAPRKNKCRDVVKVQEGLVGQVKIEEYFQDSQHEAATPKRTAVASMNELATVKKEEESNPVRLLFFSSDSYKLDYLNSISYEEGKLFNLLMVPSQKLKNGRKIKCKCSKSRCQSRYCECFSRGNICGVDCECANCNNLSPHEGKGREEERGCQCSKSRCLKNYCECYQRGQACTEKCQCLNCGNCKL